MSLSHVSSITQTWRIAISWLDTPGRILSSTWYHQWLQLVTPMRQNAQKRSRKFCRSKEDKNGETHPIQPEKGETGCVLGAGGGGSGWRRILLLKKCTTMAWWWPQQQKDLPAFLAKRCWLELPLKGAPSRRSSLKTCHRHVFLTLGPSRVQVLPRSNEKSQASRKRYLTFLAGADGLVSPAGSVSSRQSATGARSPLGTRFWGGCGGGAAGSGGAARLRSSPSQVTKERCWFGAPRTGHAGYPNTD